MDEIIRRNCDTYTPENAPEITLFYANMPGEVDICDLTINGNEVSELTFNMIVGDHRGEWEAEIEAYLKKQADDYRQDALIEAWDVRQLERRVA